MQSENTAVRRVSQAVLLLLCLTITHRHTWQQLPGRPIIHRRQERRMELSLGRLGQRRAYTRCSMRRRCARWSNRWGYTPVALTRRQAESNTFQWSTLSVSHLSFTHIHIHFIFILSYLNYFSSFIQHFPSLLSFVALTESYARYLVVFFVFYFVFINSFLMQ